MLTKEAFYMRLRTKITMGMNVELRAIADTLEIQAVLARYVFAIDAKTLDALDEVFTPDAWVDYSNSGGAQGPYDKIKRWLAKSLAAFPQSQHLIGLPAIELHGDTAHSRVMLFNPMTHKGARGEHLFLCGGTYQDEWRRTEAGLRITNRRELECWFKDPPDDIVMHALE